MIETMTPDNVTADHLRFGLGLCVVAAILGLIGLASGDFRDDMLALAAIVGVVGLGWIARGLLSSRS